MKLKLTWLLTLCMAFVMQFSFAQEKTVTGTVTEVATGFPAAGVTVLVDGTARGTQTDFDGKYSIGVNNGEVLVFSFVGYKTMRVTVGAADVYDVSLEEDVEALDEVVIVGYGSQTKKSFAGTVTTVSAENIENKNFSNVTQSLAGEAAGVTVINTTGQPGTVSTVRIRGLGSVNGNRAPLYVVDGIPITAQETLNAINPADIASTSILKDATATAIYGSRGANGVVLITTKTGSANESYVEVDVRTGLNTQIVPRYELINSPEEWLGYVWQANRNQLEILNPGISRDDANAQASANLFSDTGTIPTRYNIWNASGDQLIDPATGTFNPAVSRRYSPDDFEDLLTRDGFRYEANVRFGGGDEKTRYFVSGGFLDDNGVVVNSSFKRYNFRSNVSSQIKPWLKVGANVSYLYAESRNNATLGGAENVFEFLDKFPKLYPAFVTDNATGERQFDPFLGIFVPDYGAISIGGGAGRPASDGVNPYGAVTLDYNGYDRHEFVGNGNIDIKFTEGFTFENSVSLQFRNNIGKTMENQFYGRGLSAGGELTQTNTVSETINFLNLLRYKKDFGNHSFELLAAHESNSISFQYIQGYKTKAVTPFSLELTQYIVQQAPNVGFQEGRNLESFFANLNYDFDDRIFFTGSIRRDGSSVFQIPENRWGTFWSLGAAWVMTNESWLDSDFLRYLKVKGSYGTTGDEAGINIATGSYYAGENLFEVTNLGGNFAIALDGNIANPDITWETAKQWQVGAEFSFSDWLDGSIDYFSKDTENLFFNRTVQPSSGSTNRLVNDGVLRNSGLEVDLTFHVVNSANASLDFSVNGAMIQNELLQLPVDTPNNFLNVGGGFGWSVGRSINDFYMRQSAGVDPADGFPQWYEYYDDANDNGVLDAGEALEGNDTPDFSLEPYLLANPGANIRRTITKTYGRATQLYLNKVAIPDVSGAFRFAGNIYNFTYNLQFTYQFGGYGYDNQYRELFEGTFPTGGGTLHVDARNAWQEPGDITSVPRLGNGSVAANNFESDRFVTSSDFLALNNIQIGYSIPSKVLGKSGIDNLNLYVSGDNLWITTARKGYNPTVRANGATGRAIYAPLSTLTVGARLKF
ncbi:SusC/RagA family TonB-linked outer membrane protein [Winogradskyella aurantiaca]|uniref:SusC/RagA family TonB-linked outer membrane protein n=1 Tax=Winogradskyella aurantiaca TaxID=2219558 RepID=UPI000E1D80C9|nr:SusC/RagA family TonB-linked outer membrane protein [Winogradskyella aurantiaca]